MANTKITSKVIADANILTAAIADNAVTGDKVADDVALAGNPTTTTQTAGNSTTRIATTAFVSTAISNLVDSSPAALNTLNELAAALGDDANFSTTVTNSIATKVALSGSGQTIADSGNFTLDVAGDITLDADGGEIFLKDGGTEVGRFLLDDNNHLKLKSIQSDADILFQGNDGGSGITALRLDMSAAGKATFNASVTAPQFLVSGNTSVQGIQIGEDSSNSSNSGRLFFTESGGSWAIFNSNDSLSFNNGGTYGSSSGTQRAFLTAAGDLNIDGTFTSGGDLTIDNGSISLTYDVSAGELNHAGATFHINKTNGVDVAIGNDDLYVDMSTSRVGIGTSSPAEKLEVDGTVKATAFEGDGSSLTGVSGGISASSLATNGYVKFSNGYTIQWGQRATTASSDTVTFPTSFTNLYSIVATMYHNNNDTGGVGNAIAVTPKTNATTTGFRVSHYGLAGYYWIATGKIT